MKIQLLVMDVDGTLTDGRIYIGPNGEAMKAFDVKDGYGIMQFINNSGIPVIITGRNSKIVEQRCKELGISEVYQGVEDKLSCLKSVIKKYGFDRNRTAYIGDDVNDLKCMKYVGFSACPSDAHESVKRDADFICPNIGGHGAVRDFIDEIFKR